MTNNRAGLAALKTAIEHIAHDNGAISRHRSTAEVMQHAWYALRLKYTLAQINEIELDLLTLSPTLLEEVCTGEMPEPPPIKPLTHEALNLIFESL